ncbi:MAG: hypothetical protein HOI47_29175 [Candidatus Scalindua sp.]|jgi:hypothetical protein|nr:hypothetical protein [Candidatus Scalindua sp.]MBT6049679.1 hypothetical protein [Candidatus Scalindua sp.]MBT6230732.1 hypothetical protein [Candidatus Scalindua sp.]
MTVDPQKPRKILVIHGVQTGTDEDIDSDQKIKELVINRLAGTHIQFDTDIYKYEGISDDALERQKKVFGFLTKALTCQTPFSGLLGILVESGVDLIGDVVISLREGDTASIIGDGLIRKILEIYDEGNPLYIVAHSLGTIYAFDAVNKLIKAENGYFDREHRKTWPVQAMVTMGSPIGLSMFGRNAVVEFGVGRKYFRWINYWARTDPVVSGSFYGKPQEGYQIAEKFTTSTEASGWFIQDRVVDTGKAWLMAHMSYWDHPGIGDDLATLITT